MYRSIEQLSKRDRQFYFSHFNMAHNFIRQARSFYQIAHNEDRSERTRQLAFRAYKKQAQAAREALGWCRAWKKTSTLRRVD